MIANLLHELSLALGYDEPYDPRRIAQQPDTDRVGSKELKWIVSNTPGMAEIHSYGNSDNSYKLVSPASMDIFLKHNPVDKRVYVPEKHDCDDFSYILMGDVTRWDSDLAFGIIWGMTPSGNGHAWNWFAGVDKEIWFVEPKRDQIFKPTKLWRTSRTMI